MLLMSKKCPSCNAGIQFDCEKTTTQCEYCLTTVYIKKNREPERTELSCTPVASGPHEQRRMSGAKKALIIVFVIVGISSLSSIPGIVGLFTYLQGERNPRGSRETASVPTVEPRERQQEDVIINLGDTFEHLGLDITIGTEISWVQSTLEAFHGEYFARVPLTITNNSDEHRSFFISSFYDTNNNHLPFYAPNYFARYDIRHAGEIRPGATVYYRYIHLKFTENGDYHVRLTTWPYRIDIRIPLAR